VAKNEDEGLSNLEQIGTVTRYELLKHLRRRRVYAVLVIVAFIGLLQIAVHFALNLGSQQRAKDWASTFLGYANFIIVIVGTFYAGDAIASEFEHKTGYIILANPIKRSSLVSGKFAAALISALLAIGLYYIIGAGATFGIYGAVPIETAASFAYAVLYVCCVLGFTFLFSSLLKGSMGATLLSFFTFFLILQIVSSVITLTGIEPWFLPNYASGMISQVINPQKDTVMNVPGSPLKIYVFYPKYPISIAVLSVYFIATFILSILVTKRKQMA
jgi:ABC-type transport system involved in multi-copper enzyme maturation permease subunit